MNIYFAPMEGITGYVYRNAHKMYFPSVEKYFAPFVSPTQHHALNRKEKKDVIPENNQNICLVPQVMTNKAEYFLRVCKDLEEMGYIEVNLNLGCPSGTVVTKGKGAGFLARLDDLNQFLEEVFANCNLDVSLKTRLGMEQPEEVFDLMQILEQYPVKEWILHPRVREDYYKYTPHYDVFAEVAKQTKLPLCYNGDILTKQEYEKCIKQFPNIQSVMIGRGLLHNPALVREIKGGLPMTKQEWQQFHKTVYEGYQMMMQNQRNTSFKMKELWTYWAILVPEQTKMLKKIKKANDFVNYEAAVQQLFLSDIDI